MDIDIVNTILRLCQEQQTCLFEVPTLVDLCLEQRLCSHSRYILASVKNYMEIFRISRDQNRIEFFMPVSHLEKRKYSIRIFLRSLKSVEIILLIIHVKSMVNSVRIFTSVMIISIQILAVDRTIVLMVIN